MKYFVTVNGRAREVELVERLGKLEVSVDGRKLDVAYEEVDNLGQLAIRADGRSWGVSIEGDEHNVTCSIAGRLYAVEIEDERERAAHAAERESNKGGGVVKSIMPGVVIKLLVKEGDHVEKGQPLLVLEAMKMQNEIGAPGAGVVKALHVKEKEAVSSGAKLITLLA